MHELCHTIFTCFLGFLEKPPGSESLYRQATQACTHFLVSLMNCLAVMNFRQATRVYLAQFCDYVHSRMISNRGKIRG